MPWKFSEDGNSIELDANKNPLWIDGDGNEKAIDLAAEQAAWTEQYSDKINEWTVKHSDAVKESIKRKKQIQALEPELEAWKALEMDIEEVQKAIEKANSVDWSKIKKPEEVEAKINSIKEGLEKKLADTEKKYTSELTERERQIQTQADSIHNLVIKSRFAQSPFFLDRKKTLMTPRVAETLFSPYFRVEGDKPVCYPEGADAPLYSKKNPGELAGFDEAMSMLWEQFPEKENYTPPMGGGDVSGAGERNEGKPGEPFQPTDLYPSMKS